jgi:hypothetical protein
MEAVNGNAQEAAMNTQIDREALADAILSAGESDGKYDAWTLDELDQFSDFGLVRAARSVDDEQGV